MNIIKILGNLFKKPKRRKGVMAMKFDFAPGVLFPEDKSYSKKVEALVLETERIMIKGVPYSKIKVITIFNGNGYEFAIRDMWVKVTPSSNIAWLEE